MCHAKKESRLFSPSDLHTIFTTEDLVKPWRTYPNLSSLLLLASSVKLKKKKFFFFSESSKLYSIAYYSCQKGSVFGSQMSVTKSWLQTCLQSKKQEPPRKTQGSGGGGLLRRDLRGSQCGPEGRKDTNKYISKLRFN